MRIYAAGSWSPALPGLCACLLLSALGAALARLPTLATNGLGMLPLALLLGMLGGHLVAGHTRWSGAGLALARGPLLRTGIALYGLGLSAEAVHAVGWPGATMAVAVVLSTLALAVWLGQRVLRLERSMCLLVGAGSAICGAAAVAAADSVLRAPAREVSAAVAVVVVFGTLGMLMIPLAYPLVDLGAAGFGQWLGLTVHELGQVIAAATPVGEMATSAALVEKMLRVVLLAPAVIGIAALAGAECAARTRIPLFVWGFVLALALNLGDVLPAALRNSGQLLAQWLLACGLCALGAQTHWREVRAAGSRVWALSALLWLWLLLAGYALVWSLEQWA